MIDVAHEQRLNHVVTTIGRLKPGVTIQQAQAEMDTVFARLARQYPEIKDWGIRLLTFYDWFVAKELADGVVDPARRGGVRSADRLRECREPAALAGGVAAEGDRGEDGDGREPRPARAATADREPGVSVLGGAAGLLAPHGLSAPINAGITPEPAAHSRKSRWTPRCCCLPWVTLATGLLFGMAPAWFAAKADLNTVLKQGGRSSTGGARPLLRSALVAGELALATMLLIGAGLLTQSLLQAAARAPRIPAGEPA